MTSVEQRRKLEVMINLHRDLEAASAGRLAVMVRAQVAIEAGTLSVAQVAQVFGISASTWRRWVEPLGLRELAADCVNEVDRALRSAGATGETTLSEVKSNPDHELALGAAGVWRKP